MPSVKINGDSELYYEDSGAPHGATRYSTVFLIHGFIFHSPIFWRAFSFASSQNLRLITITLPEYPGSYSLSDEQRAKLASPNPEDQSSVFLDQVKDIARLIAHLIKVKALHPPSGNGGTKVGGVSILAWSAGGAFLLSLLANIEALDHGVSHLLGRFVTSAVFYDPPCRIFGVPPPPDSYVPINDPTLSPADQAQHFMTWVASYWTPVPSLSALTEHSPKVHKNLADISDDPKYAPSTARMSHNELVTVASPGVAARIGTPRQISLDTYRPLCRRALLDTKGAWKNVDVILLWADMSCIFCPWAGKVVSEMLQQPAAEGEQRRKVRIVKLPRANHFLHYDEPQRFVSILADLLGTERAEDVRVHHQLAKM